MKYAYLLFDLFIGLASMIGIYTYQNSKKINYQAALKAITLSAIPFIIWDAYVVNYFWSFNPQYVTGINIFNIPIEEVLFFFAIPFAMLVLWENIPTKDVRITTIISHLIIAISTITAIIFKQLNLWYSFSIAIAIIFTIIIDKIFKTNLFLNIKLYIFLITTAIFTIIFNNILTSIPIVIYNDSLKTNVLIHTMPIEDLFFGLSLIALNLVAYEFIKEKSSNKKHQA